MQVATFLLTVMSRQYETRGIADFVLAGARRKYEA